MLPIFSRNSCRFPKPKPGPAFFVCISVYFPLLLRQLRQLLKLTRRHGLQELDARYAAERK